MGAWDDLDREAGSGNYYRCNIGDSGVVQVLECLDVFTKEWPDGKAERMVKFRILDHDDHVDGAPA